MGAAGSVQSDVPNLKTTNATVARTTQDIVSLLLPVYYVDDDPTQKDLDLAADKWALIIDNKSPHFHRKKGQPGYTQQSCIMLFYDSFYARLFDIHPMAKPMFKAGLKSQGKFLVKMISLSLTSIMDKPKFVDTMTKLAEVHNNRGVKSVEYGIVGDVLFWSLRRCLGADYDYPCHLAWVRIFCSMLKIIVPLAIQWEMKNGEAQIDRLRARPPEESGSDSGNSSAVA